MTVQEAKEVLNNIWDFADAQDEEKGDIVDDAIIEAIGSMEEVEQYRALGTVEELKEAREKQVAKKPKEYEDRYYACECGNILLPKWKEYPTKLMPKSEGLPHCMACGQKLDWEEGGTSD